MLPKIYVINLDRSYARLESIHENLNELGLDYTRISAIDGIELSHDLIHRHYDPELNNRRYHKKLNKGEIACYLSHRKTWQQILADKLECAVVLEDDARLARESIDFIHHMQDTSRHWDIIKLNMGKHKKRIVDSFPVTKTIDLIQTRKPPVSNMAQLISRQGAQKLLNLSQVFGCPVDVDIQKHWKKNLNVFTSYPSIAYQAGFSSEITPIGDRNKVRYSYWKKLSQKLNFELSLLSNSGKNAAFKRIINHL